MNGKGDSPRSCFSKQFKDNYDEIFRKKEKRMEKFRRGPDYYLNPDNPLPDFNPLDHEQTK